MKYIWYGYRELSSILRLLFYKITKGLFFSSIGNGTKIYGTLRFESAHGNISIGKKCLLKQGVFFAASKNARIKIGDKVSLQTGTHLVAVYGIEIGNCCRIAEYVSIRDQNHNYEDINTPIMEQGFVGSPVVLEENVWVGRGAIIMPGVRLGEGCIVAANSVVNKSFPPNSIIGGIPAKLIKKRT